MNKQKVMYAVLVLGTASVYAGVQFGSREAGFVIEAGTLDVGSGFLNSGTITIPDDEFGSMTASASYHYDMTHRVVSYIDDMATITTSRIDGLFSYGDSLILSDYDVFHLNGGFYDQAITVISSLDYPAVIEGHGFLGSQIVVQGSGSGIVAPLVKWQGPLNQSIVFSTTGADQYLYLTLGNDLYFASGSCVEEDAAALENGIYFEGYTMSLGNVTLGASQSWYEWPRIALHGDMILGDNVTVLNQAGALHIDGHGHTMTFGTDAGFILPECGAGDFVMVTDTTFADVGAGTFVDGDINPTIFKLENVTFTDSSNSVTFRSGYIGCGDMFGGALNFYFESEIDLNKDLVIADAWTVSGGGEELTINGHGNTLTLAGSGSFSFTDGGTLVLRDMTLVVDEGCLAVAAGWLDIELSNVTVITTEAIDWSALSATITIVGPCTFVVNGNSFAAPSTEGFESTIDGVTVMVDDLGSGVGSVSGFTLLNDGRLLTLSGEAVASDVFVVDDMLLSNNIYLFRDDMVAGKAINFETAGTIVFDGQGRSLVFPSTWTSAGDNLVMSITGDSTVVETQNVVFDGFIPADHCVIDSGSSLNFGNQTTVRLGGDSDLPVNFVVGTSAGVDEVVTIDLGGHVAYLTSDLTVQGTGTTLLIKNGTIIVYSSGSFVVEDSSRIRFENITLLLDDDTSFNTGSISFEAGHSHISTVNGDACTFAFGSDGSFIIESGAVLTLTDNVTFEYSYNGLVSGLIVYGVLEMVNATFSRPDSLTPLVLLDGTIVIDHKAYWNIGDGGMTVGVFGSYDVGLVIRPGAQFVVEGAGNLSLYYVEV